MSSAMDLELLTQHFIAAVAENGSDVHLRDYCAGYGQLSCLLDSLGRIMYFVMKDVSKKLEILNKLRDNAVEPELATTFSSLTSMCNFEKTQYQDNRPVGKMQTEGCRNLLRLHRALLFITTLFKNVCTEPGEKTLCELAQAAYDGSLANYHPWLVRTSVGVAFRALPYREDFVNQLVASQPVSNELNTKEACREYLLSTTVPSLQRAYDVTQIIFTKFGMLDLP